MDMNNVNIEEIVKQVLSGMTGNAPAAASAPAASTGIPKTARVAVLTEKEHFDIKEYPIPPIGDDDILVKVEGCGVCGTDAHEFKRDPFNLIPVALGHEGTGEIVAMGRNVKVDTAGNPVKVGDKVVTRKQNNTNQKISLVFFTFITIPLSYCKYYSFHRKY